MTFGRLDEREFGPECPYCGEQLSPPLTARPCENRDAVVCKSYAGGCGRLYVVEHRVRVEPELFVKVRKVEGE